MHRCANTLCSIRRNKVRKAVYDTWKGNSIPLFKTDSAERQKLEELAATLIPTCKTKYFGERAIRQHIFDSLTEKKRRIRKGVDYTKVSMCEICIIDIKLLTMIIMQQPNDYNDYSMHVNMGCICFATQ